MALELLESKLARKMFLLVLDDMCNDGTLKWDELRNVIPPSANGRRAGGRLGTRGSFDNPEAHASCDTCLIYFKQKKKPGEADLLMNDNFGLGIKVTHKGKIE
ncbi:hypothetical protein RIF29_38529 [Crotalaria pallida]|uniref:Uncharacterized protein n=1 Tax=Crotalaria pallida TaxID=3830 RepID=A0AAN9HNV0_CROPI